MGIFIFPFVFFFSFICSPLNKDRVSFPYLPYGDGRINIGKSRKRDDVETGRAEGAVFILLS